MSPTREFRGLQLAGNTYLISGNDDTKVLKAVVKMRGNVINTI